MFVYRILAASLFTSAPAFAALPKECTERLTEVYQKQATFSDWREIWDDIIENFLSASRAVSNVEYEAIMDIAHSLPITAKFSNGERGTFTLEADALRRLKDLMVAAQMVEVSYTPESLEQLGRVYGFACRLLGRPGCEIYKSYSGLMGDGRPFSPLEELAIKWSTFHMVPGADKADVREILSRPKSQAEEFRKSTARSILNVTFNPAEAEILNTKLVRPYISLAFTRNLGGKDKL